MPFFAGLSARIIPGNNSVLFSIQSRERITQSFEQGTFNIKLDIKKGIGVRRNCLMRIKRDSKELRNSRYKM